MEFGLTLARSISPFDDMAMCRLQIFKNRLKGLFLCPPVAACSFDAFFSAAQSPKLFLMASIFAKLSLMQRS